MHEKLSIRSYSLNSVSHKHPFEQIVIPLQGMIDLKIGDSKSVIGIGNCALIHAGISHRFHAKEQASFLVADIAKLPKHVNSLESPYAQISTAMLAFCRFAETQLRQQSNSSMEQLMLTLFKHILAEQEFLLSFDPRITRVIEFMETDLSYTPTLKELAGKAFLSESQLKSLFKKQSAKTCGEYLLMLRMQKALALLSNTDFPVQIVAEKVGYKNLSAFSRRFSTYFGQSPRSYMAR